MSKLVVDQLSVCFHGEDQRVYAVQDLSFALRAGETIGIVGESGCGKSTAAMALMGLLPAAAEVISGQVTLDGQSILCPGQAYPRHIRGSQMAMIFQDPMTCLNPFLTIEQQFAMPLRRHRGLNRQAIRRHSIDLLTQVGIPDPQARLKRYPHEFSGGQRQRLMIALALSCDPQWLIADEPTTALDVTIQAQILSLLRNLQQQRGLGLILITHDLGVVAQMCDRVLVMYAGRCVESASTEDLYRHPRHPYTQALMASMPQLDSDPGQRLTTIGGQPPRLPHIATSCAFAPRCPLADQLCRERLPTLEDLGHQHQAACLKCPGVSDG